MIDTHCHLSYEDLAKDVNAVLERAKEAGIDRIIVPSTSVENTTTTVDIVSTLEGVWAGVGVHPTDVHKEKNGWLTSLEEALKAHREKIVMVGEVGLDYYHFEDATSEKEIADRKQRQKTALLQQICLAKKYSLPLSIHSRDAFADTYAILKDEADKHPYVIHCFCGTYDEAKQWLTQGAMLSVTGMITYKKNDALREVVAGIPLERLMVETDAPFLPPEGHRGEICEPRFVQEVMQCIAEVKGVSFELVAEQTTVNAERFFKLTK